jgi:hypothetical protein
VPLTVLFADYDLTKLTLILQVSLPSSSAQSGQAAQAATTPSVVAPVAAGEEATEAEAAVTVTTTATTTRRHPTLTRNHLHSPLPTPPPGGQACGLVRQLARPLATRWETATIAALRAAKQGPQTGSETEAARNLGLRGRLEEVVVEDLRGLHRLLADRGMNRRVSAGVVGDRVGKEVERKASCESEVVRTSAVLSADGAKA